MIPDRQPARSTQKQRSYPGIQRKRSQPESGLNYQPTFTQNDALRREIRDGELAPGQRLPAETTLVERFRMSLPAIRQALGVLRAEGLIESRHGIGTYLEEPTVVPKALFLCVEELTGRRYTRARDHWIARMPTADESGILELPTGAPVMHVVHIARDEDGDVLEVSESIWPADRHCRVQPAMRT